MASHGNRVRFQPTLFDRLFDNSPQRNSETDPLRGWGVEDLKDHVARDLEALLNSRNAMNADGLRDYPASQSSLLTYGMGDFVGRSLSNPADRAYICRALERTINLHEPRLRNVAVSLIVDDKAVNVLHFSINALLIVEPAQEPVSFDAMLQPTTQCYSVGRGRPRRSN